MAPWWNRRHPEQRACQRCRQLDTLHQGLCKSCRRTLTAEETPGGTPPRLEIPDQPVLPNPQLEPPHSRPWVRRGNG